MDSLDFDTSVSRGNLLLYLLVVVIAQLLMVMRFLVLYSVRMSKHIMSNRIILKLLIMLLKHNCQIQGEGKMRYRLVMKILSIMNVIGLTVVSVSSFIMIYLWQTARKIGFAPSVKESAIAADAHVKINS